jgi:integrase
MECRYCKKEIPEGSIYCNYCGRKQEKSARSPKSRGNGEGSVYKRGKTWVAQTQSRVAGVRTIKRKGGFSTRKEALAYIEILRHKRKDSRIAELWQVYSTNAMLKLSESKQTAYKLAYKRLKDIQPVKMADLNIEVLQQCVNDNSKSFYTARDMKSLLSHFFKMAMAQQEVSVNLLQFIILPDLIEEEPTPFTDDELKKFWEDYQNDKNTGYILLMVYSGMMPGELLKCKKEMVHLDGQNIIGCGLKTKKRKDTPIVYPDFIVPVLKELLELSPTDYLLGMKRNDFYDWFDLKLKELGCNDLTPYACRHTTATL